MNRRDRLIRIAGYFDGDGCVTIARTTKIHYYIMAKIGCCNVDMLREIVAVTGTGTIYRHKRNWWCWHVNNRKDVLKFLKLISPFLFIKKRQADYILDCWPKRFAQCPKKRLRMYKEMKRLKALTYQGSIKER